MICRSCGRQSSRQDRFCPGCGTPAPGDAGNGVKRAWQGFRGWRLRWQVLSWIGTGFVALMVLGALGGSSSANTAASAPDSAPSSSAPAATTSSPTPTTTASQPSGPTADDISTAVEHVVDGKFPHATNAVTCSGVAHSWNCTENAYLLVDDNPSFTIRGSGHDAYHIGMAIVKRLHPKVAKAHAAYLAKERAMARAKARAHAAYVAKQRAIAKAKAALARIGTPVARQQAVEAAQSYLEMGGFSRAKLIQQLSSKYGEGFSLVLATWAVDRVHADWNQQAVEAARSYLEMGGFSRAGLIQQLTSSYGDGFTYDQAVYAVNKVGL